MKADAWDNALFDGREDLYENGKEALVDGGYRHCAAQTCYSAGDTLPQRARQRYIFATESRWRIGICMVGRAKYHGVQNCTIITPSPPLLLSATLPSLLSNFHLAFAARRKSLVAFTVFTPRSRGAPPINTSCPSQTSYLTPHAATSISMMTHDQSRRITKKRQERGCGQKERERMGRWRQRRWRGNNGW